MDVREIAEFDRELAAGIRRQQQIQRDSYSAGLTVRDVRAYEVLMPWTGTKRWDGSAEKFTYAEYETDRGLVGLCGYADLDGLRSRVIGKNPFDPAIRNDIGIVSCLRGGLLVLLLGFCRLVFLSLDHLLLVPVLVLLPFVAHRMLLLPGCFLVEGRCRAPIGARHTGHGGRASPSRTRRLSASHTEIQGQKQEGRPLVVVRRDDC